MRNFVFIGGAMTSFREKSNKEDAVCQQKFFIDLSSFSRESPELKARSFSQKTFVQVQRSSEMKNSTRKPDSSEG